MDSMSASVYTSRPIGSSDCTFLGVVRAGTAACTADILAVVTLPERLQWVLDNRKRPDGRPWKATPLSEAADLSKGHIAQILSGRVRDPDLSTIEAIALVAGVSPTWLTMGVGTPDDAPASAAASELPLRFSDLPSWRALLSGAKVRRPTMPSWVWERVARSFPLEGASPTGAAVMHAADGILELTPPPESRPRA